MYSQYIMGLRAGLFVLSLASLGVGVRVGDVTVLGLDPTLTLNYADSELAPFMPANATMSMGPAPTDLFTAGRHIQATVVADAPLITS